MNEENIQETNTTRIANTLLSMAKRAINVISLRPKTAILFSTILLATYFFPFSAAISGLILGSALVINNFIKSGTISFRGKKRATDIFAKKNDSNETSHGLEETNTLNEHESLLTKTNSHTPAKDQANNQSKNDQNKPQYLLFDHGGVLEGEYYPSLSSIDDNNDFILNAIEGGAGYMVLKNGRQMVEKLNELTQEHHYKIAFHSANSECDQLRLLHQIQACCASKGLTFPEVSAIAVYDAVNYKKTSSSQPIIKQKTDDMPLCIYWGQDQQDGKASLRRALEACFNLGQDDRKYCTVFDDGNSVIRTAKDEGYQTVLVSSQNELLRGIQEKESSPKNLKRSLR